MIALGVYTFLTIIGIANTSPIIQEKTNEGDIFVNTFADYIISLMGLVLPEPLKMNRFSHNLITLENASVHGLRHVVRDCPVRLNTSSGADNDYINCILCVNLKDYFKVHGLFQISTFFYDTEFNPGIVQLFNFTSKFNLTVTLPKVYENTTEALLYLDGTPKVKIGRLQFLSPPNTNEGTTFSFLSELTSFLAPESFKQYIEAKIGSSIRKVIKRVNESMQKSLGKFVKKLQ